MKTYNQSKQFDVKALKKESRKLRDARRNRRSVWQPTD